MAIPISLPHSDDVEDIYRNLDMLMEQLLIILRQIMVLRRREAALNMHRHNNIRHRHTSEERTAATTTTSVEVSEEAEEEAPSLRLPLPDVVPDSAPASRKEPVRSRTEAARNHGWVQVDAELRRISDQFTATNSLHQEPDDTKDPRIREASLLSSLCPPLGGSVWTTVALLVGWGLLSRTR